MLENIQNVVVSPGVFILTVIISGACTLALVLFAIGKMAERLDRRYPRA